jgi:tripartite-type tricarboxylate transporter receptor subunit TctC
LPDVPTLAEQGLPRYNMEGWIAMIAPAGVPKQTVTKLYGDVKSALASKEVQETLAAQGMNPIGATPEATAQLFQSELARYAKIVKEAGVTVD